MTNGDKIRAMTDEELAIKMCEQQYGCNSCMADDICTGGNGFFNWLKQESEDT